MLKIYHSNTVFGHLIEEFVKFLPIHLEKTNDLLIEIQVKKNIDNQNTALSNKQVQEQSDKYKVSITIVDLDIRTMTTQLEYDEVIMISVKRFVAGINIENLSSDVNHLTSSEVLYQTLVETFISDESIKRTVQKLILNKSPGQVRELSSLIDQRKIKNNSGIQFGNFITTHEMESGKRRFQEFNEDILPALQAHLKKDQSDFLLTNEPHKFFDKFQPDVPRAVASIGKRAQLLGLVISVFDRTKKPKDLSTLKYNEVLNDITDDYLIDIEKYIETKSKELKTISSKLKAAKQNLNEFHLPKTLQLEKHYLELDEQYKNHNKNDYEHEVDRSQVLQNYRNNKKKKLQIMHGSNQVVWLNNIKEKDVSLSDGVLTLCYWTLYYYDHTLYKDIESLHIKQNLDTIIDIFLRYYTFINFDMKSRIEDVFEKINNDEEIQTLYEKIDAIEGDSNPKTKEKLMKIHDDLVESDKRYHVNTKVDLIKAADKVIDLHFNLHIIKKILNEYTYAVAHHELILTALMNEDKDITDLL